MTNYALFIDDERYPPDDGRIWMIARSSDEALMLIERHGWPMYVSFDHDLGGEDTSMRFIRAALDRLLDNGDQLPFAWTVHSQNPVGRDNIVALLQAFERVQRVG